MNPLGNYEFEGTFNGLQTENVQLQDGRQFTKTTANFGIMQEKWNSMSRSFDAVQGVIMLSAGAKAAEMLQNMQPGTPCSIVVNMKTSQKGWLNPSIRMVAPLASAAPAYAPPPPAYASPPPAQTPPPPAAGTPAAPPQPVAAQTAPAGAYNAVDEDIPF